MRDFAFDPDGTGAGKSPQSVAQENMRPALPRRFYKNVEVVECETGYTVELDGRPIKTPAKNRLAMSPSFTLICSRNVTPKTHAS